MSRVLVLTVSLLAVLPAIENRTYVINVDGVEDDGVHRIVAMMDDYHA